MSSSRRACDVIPLGAAGDDLGALACPGCRGALSLLQPDQAAPDRLLAVCADCRGWLLIDRTAGALVRLPDGQALREAMETPDAPTDNDPPRRS